MHRTERLVDFGGTGQIIQLLHANAYTPECYRKFAGYLGGRYRVLAPRQRPLWDQDSAGRLTSWNLFRDDLIDHMDKHKLRGITGIGHSLGGIASWMASIKRPDLFARLILIDPVIIAHHFVRGTRFVPFVLKKRYLPVVRIASRRRDTWPDREAARAHLGSKSIFQRFDPEVFDDFINYGIVDAEDRVTLAFPKEWEARIYSCPPNMWPLMQKSTCPVTIVKAEFSNVITQENWQKIQQKTHHGHFHEMKDTGHLIPFDRPKLMADTIIDMLN